MNMVEQCLKAENAEKYVVKIQYVINEFALFRFTAGLKTLFRFLMRSILLFVCFT